MRVHVHAVYMRRMMRPHHPLPIGHHAQTHLRYPFVPATVLQQAAQQLLGQRRQQRLVDC